MSADRTAADSECVHDVQCECDTCHKFIMVKRRYLIEYIYNFFILQNIDITL